MMYVLIAQISASRTARFAWTPLLAKESSASNRETTPPSAALTDVAFVSLPDLRFTNSNMRFRYAASFKLWPDSLGLSEAGKT